MRRRSRPGSSPRFLVVLVLHHNAQERPGRAAATSLGRVNCSPSKSNERLDGAVAAVGYKSTGVAAPAARAGARHVSSAAVRGRVCSLCSGLPQTLWCSGGSCPASGLVLVLMPVWPLALVSALVDGHTAAKERKDSASDARSSKIHFHGVGQGGMAERHGRAHDSNGCVVIPTSSGPPV